MESTSIPDFNVAKGSAGGIEGERTHEPVMSEPAIGSPQASTREADRKHNVLLLKHILDCTRDLASRLECLAFNRGTNEAGSLRFLSYQARAVLVRV